MLTGDENKFNNTYKFLQNETGMEQSQQRLLTACGQLNRHENVGIYRGYNGSTLFRNLQRRSVQYKKRDTFKARYILWFTVTYYGSRFSTTEQF